MANAAIKGRPVPQERSAWRLAIFRAEPVQRIGMIRQGVGAGEAKALLAELDIPQAAGLSALNLPPATVNRKAAQGQSLSPDESERVLGLARLVGQVQAMVEESGDPAGFHAATWLSRWLQAPVPALGGAAPLDFMDTMEGQALVSQTLSQVQSGAYG